MVFGSKVISITSTPFVSGYVVNVKHVYDAVSTQENSKEHLASTTTALQYVSGKSVEDLISKNQREKHSSEVEGRRNILRRIIDIILFLGKQGLVFRGKFEGAYSLSEADKGKKY